MYQGPGNWTLKKSGIRELVIEEKLGIKELRIENKSRIREFGIEEIGD